MTQVLPQGVILKADADTVLSGKQAYADEKQQGRRPQPRSQFGDQDRSDNQQRRQKQHVAGE